MTKVVFKDVAPKRTKRAFTLRRVRTAAGVELAVVDAGSKTLPSDLQVVFRRNVSHARKANKQLVGKSDFASRKV
jgi:hypothetical protein